MIVYGYMFFLVYKMDETLLSLFPTVNHICSFGSLLDHVRTHTEAEIFLSLNFVYRK